MSIDGLRETHDAMRALRGSFDAAMDAMRNLRAEGIRVLSNTHINRTNAAELEDLFELLERQRVRAWLVQLTVAMGRAADEPEILLEPYQLLDVIPRPREAQAPGRGGEDPLPRPGEQHVGYFGPHASVLQAHMPDQHGGACGAGRLTLGLEANGDVKGCPSLPTSDYVGGNVRDASLRDLWERSEPLRFTRQRTVEDLHGYCRTCYYAEACLGGCTWTTHVLFGKPGNNPFCHHRAIELERAGKRERLVRVRPAEGAPFDFGHFEIVVEDWPEDARRAAHAMTDGPGACHARLP